MIDDPGDLDGVDQQIRINELKARARELGGQDMSVFEDEQAPPDVLEQFWHDVVESETQPWVTDRQQLEAQGLYLPPPHSLADEEVPPLLGELVNHLAAMGTYLCRTDHLSDRRLYEQLWHETLDEEHPTMGDAMGGAWIVDMLGGCSEQDIYLHLKHYADAEERDQWRKEWPDYDMPEHQDPAYDRDRTLPQPPE